MSGIAGFSNFSIDYQTAGNRFGEILEKMNRVQKHRGADGEGIYLTKHCGLSQTGLSVNQEKAETLPVSGRLGEARATLCYDGELYNLRELREELKAEGVSPDTESDAKVILAGCLRYGWDYVQKLNGVFSFALWNEGQQELYLVRDRLGVKPLFYTVLEDTVVFASEIKGIFAYPGAEPQIDREGLCEVFGLGPAKTYGKGVFRDIREVLPGHFLRIGKGRCEEHCYWRLESRPHEDDMAETVEKTCFLVTDSVKRQLMSGDSVCAFLSGGVDSSLVTAICSEELQKQGKVLDTYSFDFAGNNVNFKANDFQPSQDRPWVDRMREFSQTRHIYLECGKEELYDCLFEAVDARDLPCMADVEASMLYFCKEVAKRHKVALTGECADEIFGGYPWFHKKECFEAQGFPWSTDMKIRTLLLKEEVKQELRLEEYVNETYQNSLKEVPVLQGETGEEKRRREIAYLNLKWFMQTLLDRMDRTAMHAGLGARVPFADYRILEYVFNVPWSMKCPEGIVKGLLRKAGEKYLPYEVLYRRKSPYPKTYDPGYESLVKEKLTEVLHESSAPINGLIDKQKVEEFLKSPCDYGRPFYGQLMAGPQLLAYLLQVNYWMEKYGIRLM